MIQSNDIDGFDPLRSDSENPGTLSQILDDANKRIVHNILKSYTGYYDVFSEVFQNSLDAVQQRQRRRQPGYSPRLWVKIDIPAGLIRVVDNGIGMTREEFKFCLRPSVSYKKQGDLRGHKGVGATFLAYGFSFIKLQSKQPGSAVGAILRQGRQWAEDTSGTVPRPKLQAIDFDVPELTNEASGTSVEILVGGASGARPSHLGWIGASTAKQWLDVLRIKTPLGGIYLSTPPFNPLVELSVKALDGTETCETVQRTEYYYPHEIPHLKVQSLTDIHKAQAAIPGDSATVFTKLSSEHKRLDGIWEVWSKEQLLHSESPFVTVLDDQEKILMERHQTMVYACFFRSAKVWGEFHDEILKLRKGQKVIQGGLQIASDYMPQGDLSIIPLTRTVGYQANCHVIVHFTDGDPDMGRKTFQPELKELAEKLSVRAVTLMQRYRQHLKPDTGAAVLTPDRELYDWKLDQEEYRKRNSLSLQFAGHPLPLVSVPRQEQDVIALFHELIGMGVLKGYRFFATSLSDRYDSLFFMDYQSSDGVRYDEAAGRLGVTRDLALPYQTEPKVLEYKYDLDSLVVDFLKEEKFAKHINLVVCWVTGARYTEELYLQSLLVGDEGSSRELYGATHRAFLAGSQHPAFEVLILQDLLNWLQSPADEEARQRRAYRDA